MQNFGWATVAAGVVLIVSSCATTSEDNAARFQEIGRIEGDQILPSGILKIDNRSLRRLDSGDVIAWVVVQLDERTKLGERSFSAHAISDCGSLRPTLSVSRWHTNSGEDGTGPAIGTSASQAAPVPVSNSSPAIAEAARAICNGSERPNVASATHKISDGAGGVGAVAAGTAIVGVGVLRGVRACVPGGSTDRSGIGALFQAAFFVVCLPFGIIGGILGAL